jgi:hypothetical protein
VIYNISKAAFSSAIMAPSTTSLGNKYIHVNRNDTDPGSVDAGYNPLSLSLTGNGLVDSAQTASTRHSTVDPNAISSKGLNMYE